MNRPVGGRLLAGDQPAPTTPPVPVRPGNQPRRAGSGQQPTAYDPDLGVVETIDFPAKDRKRWMKAENCGAWLAYPEDGADHYHEVFMLVLAARVRFVGRGGKQFGPQHEHLVAATYWAFAHGWRDPAITEEHNIRCIVEVRNGGAEPFAEEVSLVKQLAVKEARA